MSTEASLAIKSTPAEALQDAIKEATPVTATEGPSLARAAAQHHQLSKTTQLTSVQPHRMKQTKPYPEAAGAGDHNASAPATPAPPATHNPYIWGIPRLDVRPTLCASG